MTNSSQIHLTPEQLFQSVRPEVRFETPVSDPKTPVVLFYPNHTLRVTNLRSVADIGEGAPVKGPVFKMLYLSECVSSGVEIGVPSEFLRKIPESVKAVLNDEKARVVLCEQCLDYRNVKMGGRNGQQVEGFFCKSCAAKLARLDRMRCKCKRIRWVNLLAKPAPLCAECHKNRKPRRRKKPVLWDTISRHTHRKN
jgi:hypothetical protein